MNFNFIPTFLTIVRKKSISAAAEHLHVAQTTVSQRLNILEGDLGLKLIERGKGQRKIILTPAGEEFLRLAEQWENIHHDMEVLKHDGPLLTLNIGSVDSFNTFFLRNVYKLINRNSNSIYFYTSTLHSKEMYSLVENKTLDIAYTLIQRNHPNVNVRKCYESNLVLIRTGKQDDVKIHPRELNPRYELFMPWGEKYKIWHEYWWDPLSIQKIRLDDIHLLLDIIRDPMYWAIVPEWIAMIASQIHPISIQYFSEPPPSYICYELTHKNPSSTKTQAIDLFHTYFHKANE